MSSTDRLRFSVPVLLAGLSLLAVTTSHASPTPERACQAAKNKAAGKYAACRQSAEAKLATTVDAVRYNEALTKCGTKFASGWQKAIDKAAAAGATCFDAPLTESDFQTILTESTDNIADALAGLGLTDCSADLGTCTDDLGACMTDLAAAQLCGNGVTDPGEDCDFGTLNGETCMTQGFSGGTLACGAGCEFDTAGCYIATPTPTATPSPTPPARFVDNGDGTVSDTQTGLQWEKKTTAVGSGQNFADPHDVDNTYTWTAGGVGYTYPDGTAFTQFLATLNTPPCFAGYCDWRLPSEEGRNAPFTGAKELESILLAPAVCETSPCIDPIFESTAADVYFSATTYGDYPFYAWYVNFFNAGVSGITKGSAQRLRAVRGAS